MLSVKSLILIVLFLGVVLAYAIFYYKQQKKLAEKRAIVLGVKSENAVLTRRNDVIRSDLKRLKPEYNQKLWNLKAIKLELREKREDIREMIGNIKEEKSDRSSGDMGGFSRVQEKRKELLNDELSDYEAKKKQCIEQGVDMTAMKASLDSLNEEKEKNTLRLEVLGELIKTYQLEIEKIQQSPLIALPSFWKRKKSTSGVD